METFAIIDVGMGNLRSVQKAIERAAADAGVSCHIPIVADPAAIARADRVIFPGQGAFRDCARALADTGMAEAIRGQIAKGVPYLGICLGMQALFDASEEAPGARGLGVFRGTNVRLADGQRDPQSGEVVKIPHMGWNRIELENGGHRYLRAGGESAHFYFVHSYHAVPEDPTIVVATTHHGPFTITAALARDNIFATQFHPEKSQAAGLALLDAFVRS